VASPAVPWWRRPSPYWIITYGVIIVFDTVMLLPVRPELSIQLACTAYPPASTGSPGLLADPTSPFPGLDLELCKHNSGVQKALSVYHMAAALLTGGLSLMTAGFWIALSDRIGRKPVLVVSHIALMAPNILYLFVLTDTNVIATLGLWPLLSVAIFSGVCGGAGVLNSMLIAYIAESIASNLTAWITFASGMIGLGAIASPLAASTIIKASGSMCVSS
jgi:MFS family permease